MPREIGLDWGQSEKSFGKSNQGSLHKDLNHDRICPGHFLKGHEFYPKEWGVRNVIFILFFSIK
jgi:hypothetical protein